MPGLSRSLVGHGSAPIGRAASSDPFSDSPSVARRRGPGAAAPGQRFAPARNIAGCLPDSLGGAAEVGTVAGMGAVGFAPVAIAGESLL
jgi:hypothetical protein